MCVAVQSWKSYTVLNPLNSIDLERYNFVQDSTVGC